MSDVHIETATNEAREHEVKQILENVLRKYHVPSYTSHIRISSTERSHSHPILTLSTKRLDWRCILKQVIHEQMHWLKNENPIWEVARAYFKEKYTSIPSEFAESKHPEKSFLTHIIVCWNTENILRKFIPQEDRSFIDETCPDYIETTNIIRDDFDGIEKDLIRFGLKAEI